MSNQKLPLWAKKPKHTKEVIATEKGWVVKETGEILVSIKNLDQRLKQFQKPEPKKEEVKNEKEEIPLVEEPSSEKVLVEHTKPEVVVEPVEQPAKPAKRQYTRRK